MKIKLLYLFLFLASLGYCQSGDRVSMNYGRSETDFYSKLFHTHVCLEGCYPTEQIAETFYDFNILYEKSTYYWFCGIDWL